jgi:hypothetical protein
MNCLLFRNDLNNCCEFPGKIIIPLIFCCLLTHSFEKCIVIEIWHHIKMFQSHHIRRNQYRTWELNWGFVLYSKFDINTTIITFVIFFCLCFFFKKWTTQCKSFDHFSRLSLNIGLSPYLWNTWTNANATQYWTTSLKNCGLPQSVNGSFLFGFAILFPKT